MRIKNDTGFLYFLVLCLFQKFTVSNIDFPVHPGFYQWLLSKWLNSQSIIRMERNWFYSLHVWYCTHNHWTNCKDSLRVLLKALTRDIKDCWNCNSMRFHPMEGNVVSEWYQLQRQSLWFLTKEMLLPVYWCILPHLNIHLRRSVKDSSFVVR